MPRCDFAGRYSAWLTEIGHLLRSTECERILKDVADMGICLFPIGHASGIGRSWIFFVKDVGHTWRFVSLSKYFDKYYKLEVFRYLFVLVGCVLGIGRVFRIFLSI